MTEPESSGTLGLEGAPRVLLGSLEGSGLEGWHSQGGAIGISEHILEGKRLTSRDNPACTEDVSPAWKAKKHFPTGPYREISGWLLSTFYALHS